MSYRIGFLNPWKQAAEDQAFASLSIAASRIGNKLCLVRNSEEIISANLDFVLAVEPGQPKTTKVPTFGVVHNPRSVLLEPKSNLEDLNYLQTMATYDGYFTIYDTLRPFLEAYCTSIGKFSKIGTYYNTPQRQSISCRLHEIITRRGLRLCYFGINWEPRARPLFRALARRAYMRFYGPEHAWKFLNGAAYFGSVPFDGESVQKTYANFGVGLVVPSRHHLLDDIVSNRLFEISSVGAIAICPDMPWIRKYFGDSLYYYDALALPGSALRQIDDAIADIEGNPGLALERAGAARAIFEERFSAEVMLQSAIDHFEHWREGPGKPSLPAEGPLVDVIMRAGEQTDKLLDTLHSIDQQTDGRFRIMFVGSGPANTAELMKKPWKRIEELNVGEAFEDVSFLAKRSVRAKFFTVAEAGDIWFPEHIRRLLVAAEECSPGRVFAYGGHIKNGDPSEINGERLHITGMVPISGTTEEILERFGSGRFLASSELLRFVEPRRGLPGRRADGLLWANVAARSEPTFSHQATVVIAETVEPSKGSDGDDEHVFDSLLRIHGQIDRLQQKFPPPSSAWSQLNAAMQRVLDNKHRTLSGNSGKLALEGTAITTPMDERDDLERRLVPLEEDRVSVLGGSKIVEESGRWTVMVRPPPEPWAYGAKVHLNSSDLFSGPQWIVAEFAPIAEVFGVGLLNTDESDFQARTHLPPSGIPVEAWLYVHDTDDFSSLVIQNWVGPTRTAIALNNVWVVREKAGSREDAIPDSIPLGPAYERRPVVSSRFNAEYFDR